MPSAERGMGKGERGKGIAELGFRIADLPGYSDVPWAAGHPTPLSCPQISASAVATRVPKLAFGNPHCAFAIPHSSLRIP